MGDIVNLQWDNREDGTTPLRQMQLVGLRLLRIVNYICLKYRLNYFIIGGTLLGAVRHKGFIPWDDDVDVALPIEDFKKFVSIINNELPEDVCAEYTFRKYTRNHYPCLKLYDAYSSAYAEGEIHPKCDRHKGISLDVFAFMPYVNDDQWHFKFLYRIMGWVRMMVVTIRYVWMHPLGRVVCGFCDLVFDMFNCGRKFYWGLCPWIVGFGSMWRFKNNDLFPCKPIMFEGLEFMGPNNPDAYLRYYGDYMTLPPEEQRKPHVDIIRPFTKCNHPRAMGWPKKR